MTYKEQFEAAMKCETKDEADSFLQSEITRYKKEYGKNPDEAKRIILSNLGYMAGYYGNEEAEKVHRLFGAVHPIFGSSDYHKTVTPEKAFEMGKKFAERK